MSAVNYRAARVEDAHDIDALLVRLAPEIPLFIDTLARREALYGLIRRCTRSGESWIALDAAGQVVGFVLAELNENRRHYAEHSILDLHHAGVAPEHRQRGIFATLIGKLQERRVPITATVHAQNSAEAARHLERRGFRDAGTPGSGERHLRWEP